MQAAMQGTVKQAVATSRAQSTMDPVKLIASDGSEIIVDRRAALVSRTIKAMLAGPGASPLPVISAALLAPAAETRRRVW